MKTSPISFQEKMDWLRLIRTPSIGPIRFWKLLGHWGTAEKALHFLEKKQGYSLISKDQILREKEKHHTLGSRLVFHGESEYPELLMTLEDAPPVLSIRGSKQLQKNPCLSIVGGRNASLHGRRFTEKIAQALGENGITVVSGLARGIDTAAHEGSLLTGTIAVIAGGIDQVYPLENKELYEKIAVEGLIISESPFGLVAQVTHFPRRNRLIAGISWGTLVIEAALSSGSLITAHCALRQGREVFAVPGFPTDPRSQGSNSLIKEGAILVESVDDILKEFTFNLPQRSFSFEKSSEDCNYQTIVETPCDLSKRLIEVLSPTPLDIDAIIRDLAQEPASILGAITQLELQGQVVRHIGNRISSVQKN